ncbi:disulfide bond formation protein DsbB [Paenochrobactrum gallinarii]|uniref:Disulfide bond formation protein DsbB n=1 Tax=Paenochrobactrum gallinarii TaxID=643673 RepID=A0A841M4Y4_9HYPH|nr:disulfide bond formation protein B [Paenochrobactrum gallinarii]MBB6260614.1 disulfide bond formation protein DsbB [Paenochrobactrum gallinarii]
MSIFKTDNQNSAYQQHQWTALHFLYLLGMMFVLASILTAAMILQYGFNELPCPLCLLQRLAMLGVCFGVMLQFRYGLTFRYAGISLLFAVFLLIVSVRQTLLDIYVRPGHDYVGSAVLGLHMPVWSVLIALALILATSLQMIVWGGVHYRSNAKIKAFPLLYKAAFVLSLYVLLIAAVNTASVLVQCGTGQCHTTAYVLLQ